MAYPLANALFQWEEGNRRFEEMRDEPGSHRAAWRAIGAIQDELRRRIGPTFTAAGLAEFYGQGTDWCQEVALAAAPELEPQLLADAAFWLYLRRARDFAGGRPVDVNA
jgi:hypothetical protein